MNVSISSLFTPTGKYSPWYKQVLPEIVVWVCGHAHNGHRSYSGHALAQMIADHAHGDWDAEVAEFLKQLNGNWALVTVKGNILYAASDRTRSFPLLYSELSGALRISDCITKVCSGRIGWCSKGIEEFLWSGYPTGMSTVVDGVYQIPAGMCLRYDVVSKGKSFIEYFSFLPTSNNTDHEDQLSQRLSGLLDEAIVRTGELAHGRIVVPLSGGMDSRVIAALFKKNGFEDVLCFSYGRKGNPESEASKRVAEALGYEWHFVEYSPQTWASCMFSQEMKRFFVFACNACSMPEHSSWHAVKILRESGRVSAGDTFVPGHTGDFLTGGHIPKDHFTSRKRSDLQNIADHITQKHFSLWSDFPPEGIRLRILEDLLSRRNDTAFNNIEAASVFEMWDWRERQAKMIVNADRVYEYFDCRWLLPLWDSHLTDFYLTVPFRLRRNRMLFYHCSVTHVFSDRLATLSDMPLAGPPSSSPRRMLEFAQQERSWRVSRRAVLKEQVRRCLLATRTGRMALKMRRGLLDTQTLQFPHHALMWSHSFADGKDPKQYTVRQVFERHGLGDVLGRRECESVSKFVDVPVAYIHPYGLSSLCALAQMWALMGGPGNENTY